MVAKTTRRRKIRKPRSAEREKKIRKRIQQGTAKVRQEALLEAVYEMVRSSQRIEDILLATFDFFRKETAKLDHRRNAILRDEMTKVDGNRQRR